MNDFLMYVSDYSIPIIIFYIVMLGLFNRSSLYEDFLVGAKEGVKIVVDILPTLIGLMVAIGVMRTSGIFEMLIKLMKPITSIVKFPSELIPLVFTKLFSSSAATSMLTDIYKEYGTDSYLGILASVIMSSSETVFYVLAVYCAAGKIKKTRYIILGGLFATIIGIVCACFIVKGR